MNYFILTGTSRGLGEALTYRLISEGNYLFCISRRKNEEIIKTADKKKCSIEYSEYDLNNLEGIDTLIEKIFKSINPAIAESVCLINNAGMVKPIKPIGKCSSDDIISNMGVNAIAPMILISQFIRLTEKFKCERKIINISSGAGRNPYYGWGCYCSSKAAIDMYTRCAGLEQDKNENPVRIISFAPGIIDTGMQAEIRQSKIEDFEQVERFIGFKENGNLREPDFVAQKVVSLIEDREIKTGALIDLKELLV